MGIGQGRRLRSLALLLLFLGALLYAPHGFAQERRRPFRPDAALDRLRRERGAVRARVDQRTGEVRFLKGRFGKAGKGNAGDAARQFFADYSDLFGLTDPARELEPRQINEDDLGYVSVRFEQRMGGVPVLGGDIRVEIDKDGTIHSVHGRLLPHPQPPALRPAVTADRALALARGSLAAPGVVEAAPALYIARDETRDRLVWQVHVQTEEPARWQILVDALGGGIVERRDILAHAKNRNTYSANFGWQLPGVLVRREGQPAVTDDLDVDLAHDHAGAVYDYYWSEFGRDSLDGAGRAIQSSVHYVPPGQQSYNGAFWNGAQVVYGDGDAVRFGPAARSLDVVAHELTHGVTQSSARLIYWDEPGALNEAYSDIFGALIAPSNWEIGEEIVTPSIPGDALRSLAEPTRYGQPSRWGEYIATGVDNGGVHVNSGILNRVAYMIGVGIGRAKLGQIFYRTLTQKLTSVSDFADARELTLQSCQELIGAHGITDFDCYVVQTAFANADLGEPPAPPAAFTHRAYLPLVGRDTQTCGGNLARNGGFEAGQTGWPNTFGIIDNWPERQSGSRAARFKNAGEMLQLLQLPSGVRQLVFRAAILSENGASVAIRLEDAETRQVIGSTTNVGSGLAPGWQPAEVRWDGIDERRRVRLVFEHEATVAPLYLDDVSVEAVCAP